MDQILRRLGGVERRHLMRNAIIGPFEVSCRGSDLRRRHAILGACLVSAVRRPAGGEFHPFADLVQGPAIKMQGGGHRVAASKRMVCIARAEGDGPRSNRDLGTWVHGFRVRAGLALAAVVWFQHGCRRSPPKSCDHGAVPARNGARVK